MAVIKNGTAFRGKKRKKTKPKKMLRDTDRGQANAFVLPADTLEYRRRVEARPGVQAERKIAERKKATGVKKKKKRKRSQSLLFEGGTYKQRLRKEEEQMGRRWV
jgi:hypothetical protein